MIRRVLGWLGWYPCWTVEVILDDGKGSMMTGVFHSRHTARAFAVEIRVTYEDWVVYDPEGPRWLRVRP